MTSPSLGPTRRRATARRSSPWGTSYARPPEARAVRPSRPPTASRGSQCRWRAPASLDGVAVAARCGRKRGPSDGVGAGPAAVRPRATTGRVRRSVRERSDADHRASDRQGLGTRRGRDRDQPCGLGHLACARHAEGREPARRPDRRRFASGRELFASRDSARSGTQRGVDHATARRSADDRHAAASHRFGDAGGRRRANGS